MNNLQIFKSTEFGQIRGFKDENNEPWFVGKDVAEALGYVKARNAIATHVLEDDKKDAPIQGDLGGTQQMTIINESGLYALIFGSKLESAKKFKHWVTSEVLPSIRKNGAYMTEQTIEKALTSPDFLIQLATQLKEEQEARKQAEQIIEQQKSKVVFADAVSASSSSILIGDLAKLICQNGVDIGQKRLFQWLRENGYLIKRKGSDWNMPTQRAVKMGLFEIKESSRLDANGCNVTTKTTKATGKGQVYFINKFLAAVQN